MKIERTKNATRNMFFATVLKLYQTIVPFVLRTVIIYSLGVEYAGLNGLFASILQVLNLTELGAGAAMTFCMYKPIAEDDEAKICALMKLYRLYYRAIGTIIAIIGLLILPFMPKLISGEVPRGINIYWLYLLNLGATVMSYWLFAYQNSILIAHQRTDVESKVTLVTNTFQYISQITVLLVLKNYYLYVVLNLISQILNNILIAKLSRKIYPTYCPKGNLPREEIKEINHKIIDLFMYKIGRVVVNSVDTIVISAFLGLVPLGIYQNYYYILSAVMGFVDVPMSACSAGIGNSLVTESKSKNYNDLNKITFLMCWILGVCSCCFLNLYQPFMELWVGKNLTFGWGVVVCLTLYFYVIQVEKIIDTFKNAAGIWHKDRFRPLACSLVNLSLNLIMVQFLGIYGVIVSTIFVTVAISIPWLLKNLFSEVFDKEDLKKYLGTLSLYCAVTVIVCSLTVFICRFIVWSQWLTLLIRGVIACIVPNIIFFLVYRKMDIFKEAVTLLDKMRKNKLGLSTR